MNKVCVNTGLFLLRRSYSAAVEKAIVQPVKTAPRKVTESSSAVAAGQKEIFWMRDPKSGNWIPETHFDEVDVAELRKKFLCQKKKI